ncbi:MAG TPA: FAD-dependent oxidoreductase, partial [Mucilaginibacter sp.]|nr:FAD-dependent oxidoreductase [Mucilaginibacter sp.]
MAQVSGKRTRIVIIGAGFAGLRIARSLNNTPAEIYLIDRHNYHEFQPLMYQVATAR